MFKRINLALGGLLTVALLAVSSAHFEDKRKIKEERIILAKIEYTESYKIPEWYASNIIEDFIKIQRVNSINKLKEGIQRNIDIKIAEEEARAAEEARVNRVRIPMEHEGWYITAEYENVDRIHYTPHTGIDFGNGPSYGWSAMPAAKGVVTWAGWGGVWPGCGYWVAIYHEQFDETTIYCHLAGAPYVNVGQHVDPDTPLGEIGSTGYSFGIHLHFGVYRGNQFVENHYNPRDFFRKFDIIL